MLISALVSAAGAEAPAHAAGSIRVDYLDASGNDASATGADIRYVYYRRTYSRRAGKDGVVPFTDEEIDSASIPFQTRRISFHAIRSIRFDRREGPKGERLVLTFVNVSGQTFDLPAASLEGAEHPISPEFRLRSGADTIRFPIDPLTPSARLKGRLILRSVSFERAPPPAPRRRP